jgi:hypothetical protein
MAGTEKTEPQQNRYRGLKPFQPGQSGNPAGRPKGARSKLGEAFLEALLTDFADHGVQAIEDMRAKNPGDYVKTVASILPKEFDAGEQTLDILTELLARVDGRTRNILPTQETAH